jgi:hypothetical protein
MSSHHVEARSKSSCNNKSLNQTEINRRTITLLMQQ